MSGSENDTRTIGTVTEARGEPSLSEEQGEAWSLEDAAVKLPPIVTLPLCVSDKEGPCARMAEVSECEVWGRDGSTLAETAT